MTRLIRVPVLLGLRASMSCMRTSILRAQSTVWKPAQMHQRGGYRHRSQRTVAVRTTLLGMMALRVQQILPGSTRSCIWEIHDFTAEARSSRRKSLSNPIEPRNTRTTRIGDHESVRGARAAWETGYPCISCDPWLNQIGRTHRQKVIDNPVRRQTLVA
jgi:hypothetical protein